jgi:DNA-binding response OmpR family regulator
MSLQCKRILVIEDELLLALCVGQALEEQGCIVIGPATSVRQGLNLVEKTTLNGAILDINLNGGRQGTDGPQHTFSLYHRV